ncbi:Scr1 family TA system antitoxin-like transcriptional regulator [Streptomyces sp. SL13]|uniref:Scr1 family TA system antitoxin-like transcriptional regulator n=1 Tax=Streptantibioticus silvisoli TaxID=2705255 RepID=A0AA90H8V6_9ACTN|nr:Scr1 family TA system antitoxin-like transcriptional regulator [Streptantibioticus silvisoli]MDI5974046.1 Scr1 family TA system antitoxin-like transcriptional regulator [Streptantibioticus silvisoli]
MNSEDFGVGRLPEEPDAVLRMAGAVLKRWRRHSGLNQEEFGARIGFGADMVASVELGRRVPSEFYLTAADSVCDAHGTITVLEPHIRHRPRPQQVAQWAEESGPALSYFAPLVVPDLFSAASDSPADEDRTPAGRRRRVLESGVPICLVLDQAALLRVTGDRTDHGQQLQYLIDLGDRPNIVVQVLPFDAGEPLAFEAPVTLVHSGDELVAVVDTGLVTFSLPPTAAREAERRFAVLRSIALPPRVSRDLIVNTAEEMNG